VEKVTRPFSSRNTREGPSMNVKRDGRKATCTLASLRASSMTFGVILRIPASVFARRFTRERQFISRPAER